MMREFRDSIDTQTRKQSLDDINLDQFLKIANYEDTVKELDVYYGIGECFVVKLSKHIQIDYMTTKVN